VRVHDAPKKSSQDTRMYLLGPRRCTAVQPKYAHLMSKQEIGYLHECHAQRAIPTIQILVKDHKKPNADGSPVTRPVIPAGNFAACTSNIGYRGIKTIFDNNNINYSKRTIVAGIAFETRIGGARNKAFRGDDSVDRCSGDVSIDKIRNGEEGDQFLRVESEAGEGREEDDTGLPRPYQFRY